MEIDSVDDSFSLFFSQNQPVECPEKQPFISALLHIKGLIRKLLASRTQFGASSPLSSDHSFSLLTSIDTLHFGMPSYEIQRLKTEGIFYKTIADRRKEIREYKEHWSPFINAHKDQEFYNAVDLALSEGKLISNPSGAGGAYFLVDNRGVNRFVVKPVDEDISCLNNRKTFGSVFNDHDHRVKEDIPLYRSAQTDAFCWEVASLTGLESTTPKAVMGIITDESFYDFTQWIDGVDRETFFSKAGFPDREKVASIQEFIPDSQDLIELLHSFYQEGLSDEEIASHFDQKDFEEVCLFLWLTYENDGHGGNFLSYVKGIDEGGKKTYGIKKIDNGLSFPEKNSQYSNILAWLPNSTSPISNEIKNKIATLPIEQIVNRMGDYELTECEKAFKERMEILKELAQRDGVTAGEIDLRFSFLSQEGGRELVLSPMSTKEILDRLLGKASSSKGKE